MAEGLSAWGNVIGHWRCGVSAWVSSETDETVTVSVQCQWMSIAWGFQVRYVSAWVSCEGQSDGRGDYYANSAYGQTKQDTAYDQAFTLPKTDAPRTVRCAANIVFPDYEAGSSYAEVWLTIPGKPVDAPAAPTGVDASRQSDALWLLSWDNADTVEAPYTSVRLQVREGDGDWGAPTDGDRTISPATESATWVYGRANSSYAFRVRASNAAGDSAWAESGTVYTTPAAPTGLSAIFAASSGSVQLAWTNAAPYAAGFEVECSANGTAWTDAATPAATATGWTDSAPPDGSAWYRVRSKTPDGLYSAWATVGPVSTYTSADYPTVSITAPQSPVHQRPVTAQWTVGGPDPAASQDVALMVGGVAAEAASLSASARSYTFDATSLPDGGTATVVVSVTDTKGLSTTAVLDIAADWWPPASPSAVAAPDCDGHIAVTVAAGSGSQASPTAYFDVVRTDPDGSQTAIAYGVQAGTVLDAHPPVNAECTYTITAYSSDGKSASATVRAHLRSRGGFVDFPDGWSFPVMLRPELSETVERGGEAVEFAGGSPYPVWYPSPATSVGPSASFAVMRPDFDALRARALAADEVWLRDGFGHVWHGHPSWSFAPATGNRYIDVTLKLTVTEVR